MKMPYAHEINLKKGIAFVVLSSISVTIFRLLVALLEDQTTIPTMLFFRNIIGLIIILPFIIKQWPKSLHLTNKKLVFTRSILSMGNLLFIFLALQKISLVDVTLLNSSAPFFVFFLIPLFLKTKIQYKALPAIILGFIGVFFVLNPDKNFISWEAIYALLSGVCLSIVIVTIRLTTKSEPIANFLLYLFLIGLVLITPFAIFDWHIENSLTLLGLLGLGLFSTLSKGLLFHGLKFGKAHVLAPFSYSAVIFAGFFDWLLWKKVPSLMSYIGLICIVGGGLWIAYTTSKKSGIDNLPSE